MFDSKGMVHRKGCPIKVSYAHFKGILLVFDGGLCEEPLELGVVRAVKHPFVVHVELENFVAFFDLFDTISQFDDFVCETLCTEHSCQIVEPLSRQLRSILEVPLVLLFISVEGNLGLASPAFVREVVLVANDVLCDAAHCHRVGGGR